MALAVNTDKSKYMMSTSRDVWCVGSQITADSYTFDVVKEFIYLGTVISNSCQQVLFWS